MSGVSQSEWVVIAHLLRPQGRRGEILAEPLSDLPDIFATVCQLFMAAAKEASPPEGSSPVHIQEHWYPTGKNAGRIVLKLSGCDSISDAEALAGHDLLIASSQLPTLEADTYFVGDLVGCTLEDAGRAIGTIVGVDFPTGPDGRTRLEEAAPLLAVQLAVAAEQHESEAHANSDVELAEHVLIPFVRAWLDAVDIQGRRVLMHLPQGLLHPSDEDEIASYTASA